VARFEGKRILITGAAHGQGAEEARRCVSEGGKVVIGDIDDETGAALARELGSNARYLHLDVGAESDWLSVAEFVSREGPLHGLVNNAAIFVPYSMSETTLADFERHVRVNQVGCFLGMRFAAQAMVKDGTGSIVNIASSAGLKASPGAFAYSATKWAVRGMTKSAQSTLRARTSG
jgi:3alpha(or 20beta)-hydroxysteroid dehydrogenase